MAVELRLELSVKKWFSRALDEVNVCDTSSLKGYGERWRLSISRLMSEKQIEQWFKSIYERSPIIESAGKLVSGTQFKLRAQNASERVREGRRTGVWWRRARFTEERTHRTAGFSVGSRREAAFDARYKTSHTLSVWVNLNRSVSWSMPRSKRRCDLRPLEITERW